MSAHSLNVCKFQQQGEGESSSYSVRTVKEDSSKESGVLNHIRLQPGQPNLMDIWINGLILTMQWWTREPVSLYQSNYVKIRYRGLFIEAINQL